MNNNSILTCTPGAKRQQVIALTNGDPAHKCTYASPGLNELMQENSIVQAWELYV